MARFWTSAIFLWVTFACGASFAQECRPDEIIRIGGLQYETGAFNTALVAEFIKRGFDCKVVLHKGETLPLIEQLVSGDIDLLPEVWTDDAPLIWTEALGKRKVSVLTSGELVASEGWYIPKFTSNDARIFRVEDLKASSKAFLASSSDQHGRFVNCPFGSQCQIVNSKKLRAYRLASEYVDFVPESYDAVERMARAAIDEHQPILFYFWEPSSLINTGHFQKVQEPKFDRQSWQAFSQTNDPLRACETPPTKVAISAGSAFVAEHKLLAEFLSHISLNADQLSTVLLKMRTNGWSPALAATDFLRSNADLWRQWVDADTARRIDATL